MVSYLLPHLVPNLNWKHHLAAVEHSEREEDQPQPHAETNDGAAEADGAVVEQQPPPLPQRADDEGFQTKPCFLVRLRKPIENDEPIVIAADVEEVKEKDYFPDFQRQPEPTRAWIAAVHDFVAAVAAPDDDAELQDRVLVDAKQRRTVSDHNDAKKPLKNQ